MSAPEGTAGRSLSFDRAADYYDNTRIRSEEVEHAVDLIAGNLGGAKRVLEIGVGTGRVALPLAARGHEVFGMDLSLKMMEKLRAKEGGLPIPLVQADASRLPFRDGAFEGAYAIWVLHLIPSWRTVLDELIRAVASGGSIVVARGGRFGEGPWADIEAEFKRFTEAKLPGPDDLDDVDPEMAARGCEVHDLPTKAGIGELTANELLDRLAGNQHSFTWVLDEDTLRRGVEHTRRWAEDRFGDLDAPAPNRFVGQWRRYDLP